MGLNESLFKNPGDKLLKLKAAAVVLPKLCSCNHIAHVVTK